MNNLFAHININFPQILAFAFSAYFSRSGSIKVGSMQITVADVQGAPAHMTFPQALQAVEAAFAGQPATIQSGDIVITVAPIATAPPAA